MSYNSMLAVARCDSLPRKICVSLAEFMVSCQSIDSGKITRFCGHLTYQLKALTKCKNQDKRNPVLHHLGWQSTARKCIPPASFSAEYYCDILRHPNSDLSVYLTIWEHIRKAIPARELLIGTLNRSFFRGSIQDIAVMNPFARF